MFLSKRFVIGLLIVSLAGCAGPIAKRVAMEPLAIEANNRLKTGDYEGAMQLFGQLARTSRYPDYFRLQAADTALRAGDSKATRLLADTINPDELDEADQDQLLLLKSRLDLSVGHAREAMSKLAVLDINRLDISQKIHYYTLRASAYNQLGNMLESARDRIALGSLLTHPDALQKNNEAIHEALNRLPDPLLANLQNQPPNVLGGWAALTLILKNQSAASKNSQLAEWKTRFPGHPAAGVFLDDLGHSSAKSVQVTPLPSAPVSTQPAANVPGSSFIGVMLPLSGPYASAAAAIRTGMVAAYDADPNPAKKSLRFVDTQSGDVNQLYRQLVNGGAAAVIGPLVKEQVTALVNSGDLSVPVLALNQINEASHDQVVQFGLTPENEVEQAVGSAWFDGRQNALMLAPATPFGQRLINHFVGYWKQLGGKIVAIKTYPHHGNDFSASVGGLLAAGNIASSQATAINPISPAAAGANTADFVLLIADARDAHLIIPQFESQQTGRIPIYATSHVFSGKPNPATDQDLSGLIFCDIPWLLNPGEGGSLSVQSLNSKIQQVSADYVKLIAMGLDAYRLIPELDRLKENPTYRYSGATGSLSLKAGNRLERQLSCAQFQNGIPEVRGTAPVIQSGNSNSVMPQGTSP